MLIISCCIVVDCTLYTGPTEGQSVDVANSFVISWDKNCLAPSNGAVDISLAVDGSQAKIYTWGQVDFSKGSYEVSGCPMVPSE